ncbi:hypothetical protein Tco_0552221 [Tanacetum coccineum]
MIRRRHDKTPYELLHDKPPDLSYLHVFGALERILRKMDEKQSQNDKTGLGMEKTVKDKAKSKPKSQSSQKVNRKEVVPKELYEPRKRNKLRAIPTPPLTWAFIFLRYSRETFEEVLQDFQDTSESSDDNTNVVNAPREPIVVNQDPGKNSSPSPPHIDHCCHECGDSLDGIFCRQCTSRGIPDSVCDVPLCNDPTPLEAFKEHSETIIDSNDDNSSSDDDSTYGEDIEYGESSPSRVENYDILREKLLNVNLLIAKIDSLRISLLHLPKIVIKVYLHCPDLFLEETNTFDNSIPESETFRFNLEEISSGSPTTHSDLSLPDYKAFLLR